MGALSIWHWLIVLAVVLLLFGGGGKIPRMMRDLGEGVTAFKKGLKKPGNSGDDAPEEGATTEKRVSQDRGDDETAKVNAKTDERKV